MRLSRGAVVTASIGSPSGKPRPFLVLRSDHFAAHALVTIVAFTGTITEAPLLRVTVQPSAENGLRAPSQAMIDHIQSVRAERIEQEIGRLAGADLLAITRAVAVYLGFADPGARQRRTPR
ncbi:MAG TPA: type II toxin-antitoxin system PemK/MazF family toxin [Xanthobacteraceae bacterium]|nr:type II toxin-antitoxin system PemK/MazF family toxin [Xanthobacteraceae bacterium]